MSLQTNRQTRKGECDCCPTKDVELFPGKRGLMMCKACRDNSLLVEEKTVNIVEKARQIDTLVELKQDIFNAATTSIGELQAAIEHNDEIPSAQKLFSLAAEVSARIDRLDAVIFAENASLIAKQNERFAYAKEMQNIASRLHESERAKFKQYDVNYKPITPKSVKPKAVKAPSKKFDKAALYAAAKKYNVPATSVQSVMVAQNLDYEAAAMYMAKLMGLL